METGISRFKIIGRIGQGANGFVMKGIDKQTDNHVALKQLAIKDLDEGIPKNIMREITTLKVLKHENIVQLVDIVPHGMGIVIVMEYMPSNLHLAIQSLGDKLTLPIIKAYLWMLLEGVRYMHKNSIMHRDLKPTNLLISDEGVLKIGDFGLARIYVDNEPGRSYSYQVATRWYRAPELLYGAIKYTNSVDMWALGCITAEMINREPLFPGETDIEQLAMVNHILGTPTEETWPGLSKLPDYNKVRFTRKNGNSWSNVIPNTTSETKNFIKSLLVYDQTKRMSAQTALHHKFFSELPIACRPFELPKGSTLMNQEHNAELELMIAAFDQLLRDF